MYRSSNTSTILAVGTGAGLLALLTIVVLAAGAYIDEPAVTVALDGRVVRG